MFWMGGNFINMLKIKYMYILLICVPWEVFPMCYPFLAHEGKSFGFCPMYFMFYFVLDFG
jgi:hypothetical protein